MKINLAGSAGFCFGVKRAIDIALKTATTGKNVYMLGYIVHNEDVVRHIEEAGIKRIKKLSSGKGKTLLIRAHGAGMDTYKEALEYGYKIVDATCPMVKEIHRIARDMERKGYKIIVIGDKEHDEVRGIVGQLKDGAAVIDDIKHTPLKSIKKFKKACVVVQSTQNSNKVFKIVGVLSKYINGLEFFNTICKPTQRRQEEIVKMPLENDVMIIIGSKKSANTRRLYEISKSLNKCSHWVNSRSDIKRNWFKNAKTAGVTSGASTPDSITQEIIDYIRQIK